MERGYSTHTRHLMGETLEKEDQPVLTQLKKAYWTTKQQIRKTIGKKEDEHITASDAELDAKLELFRQIKLSCIDLLKVILNYQKRLVVLAREENAMGKFLRSQGEEDTTQAGKMMTAVGKSQSFSAQQRIQMRQPLFRLFQEVETFHMRAVVDTQLTVTKMEEARTNYRGALLWMKDVSERLDPDAYNRLEKFRKVQAQVRKAKELFDKQKLNVLQKVDLLAASRSNMFSHALSTYQHALLSFWKKTSKTMNAVSETYKGFQYYEFNMLKNDLDETTKELARQTASERTAELLESLLQDTGHQPESEEDRLIYDIIMSLQNRHEDTQKTLTTKQDKSQQQTERVDRADRGSPDSQSGLIDFDDKELENEDARADEQFGAFQAAIDKETKAFDLIGVEDKYSAFRDAQTELLDDIFGPEEPLLDSNLGGLSLQTEGASADLSTGRFLPSDLLDSPNLSQLQAPESVAASTKVSDLLPNLFTQGGVPDPPSYDAPPEGPQTNAQMLSPSQPISTWYNLFADLDPLQDPDAIGRKTVSDHREGCA